MTSKLDRFLAYPESRRVAVCAIAGILTAIVGWADKQLPDATVGFLYLLPILVAASVLNAWQIVLVALLCGLPRETFDPLSFGPGGAERLSVVVAGFAMTGLFVAELNARRRNLVEHLAERERQNHLRQEAEQPETQVERRCQ
jgi:heme exporter protein D